jgi:hypothetical protein
MSSIASSRTHSQAASSAILRSSSSAMVRGFAIRSICVLGGGESAR